MKHSGLKNANTSPMPLISAAGFPIAYRLGYRGGKVEARKKLNDDIRAIAIALNPPPNTWLPRAYQDHWLGSPTARVSAHNFSQWFQRVCHPSFLNFVVLLLNMPAVRHPCA